MPRYADTLSLPVRRIGVRLFIIPRWRSLKIAGTHSRTATMISKAHLDSARVAWEQARDRAAYEHIAYAMLTKSKSSLIDSLRVSGLTPSGAQAQFDKYMDAQSRGYGAAVEALGQRSNDYAEAIKSYKNEGE